MLCCLLRLVSDVTQVTLPYALRLTQFGFEILDSNGVRFPLYLLKEVPANPSDNLKKSKVDDAVLAGKIKLKTQHVIRFE